MDTTKEILLEETYNKFIDIALYDAPLEEWKFIIDDKIMAYGTAADEKLSSVQDTLELIMTQREQVKTLDDITYVIKPVLKRIFNNESSALIVNEIDLTTVINGENNVLPIRISTVLEYIDSRWFIIHWHGSIAEHVSDGKDPWHVNEWKQKAAELEVLVEEKTNDLLLKNRELEIEASLERVRAIALSMNDPADMLDVCRIISDQLKQLNVKDIRNIQTVIINESKGTYLNYQYFTAYSQSVTEETESDKHPIVHEMVKALRKSEDSFFTGVLKGEKLDTFREYRKSDNQFPDPVLDKVNSAYYYFYSIGHGGLGITTYRQLSKEGLEIFKRFHNVFKLAYRRFIDIEKAEAQAREAQVEAALERIRSQATAMKESSDLLDIVVTMNAEFNALGHEAHYFWHMHWLPDTYEKAMTSGDGSRIGMVMQLPRGFHENAAMLAWEKNKEPVLVVAFDVQGAIDYVDKMVRMGRFSEIDHNAPGADDLRAMGGLTFVMARTTHGEIGYSLPGIVANPPAEDLDTLVRFAGVFDLAYRRFEDLKSAERQNRETRIELALERVRAITMSMHKSDELADTAVVVFRQLQELGIAANRAYIGIIHQDNGTMEAWTTDDGGAKVKPRFFLDSQKSAALSWMYQGWKDKKKSITIDLQGKALEEHTHYLTKVLQVPYNGKTMPKRRVQTLAYFKQGFIGMSSPEPLPEETIRILERFTAVFNLTYTRFNDLKQAEAQHKIIQAENDRRAKELEEARQLQLAMLPTELPKVPHLEVAVYMKTSTEVGGDYYDFNVNSNNALTAVIGDATGHGLKAGMLVTATKSLFESLAPAMEASAFLRHANRAIKKMHFATLKMALTVLKIDDRQLFASGAGMPPLLIHRHASQTLEELNFEGMPLGSLLNFPYKAVKVPLYRGDKLVLMSDGFPERQNIDGIMLGYERAHKLLAEAAEDSPQEMIEYLVQHGDNWAKGRPQDDDITFVIIEVK